MVWWSFFIGVVVALIAGVVALLVIFLKFLADASKTWRS